MSDSEHEWEDVNDQPQAETTGDIDIVINAKKRTRYNKETRQRLEDLHKIHLQCLAMNAVMRNRACDDGELKATLLSLIPEHLTNGFKGAQVSKNATGRRTAFLMAVTELLKWWNGTKRVSKLSSEEGEGVESLLVQALSKEVSMEVSALLFVALCRSIGLEARVIISLQPAPFKLALLNARSKDEDTPPKKKRKTSTTSATPTIWAELLYIPANEWIPVDVIRGSVNEASSMCPPNAEKSNIMAYVVALSQLSDRLKDVTRKYDPKFTTRATKLRMEEFWARFITLPRFCRGQIAFLEAERNEDRLMNYHSEHEELPRTIGAYLNHPKYVLERHLKKFEFLYPKPEGTEHVVGQINGENVYPRSLVQLLHTQEKWYSAEGRVIREGEEPVKFVKSQSANKKSIKVLGEENGDGTVGLYGLWQTDIYVPKPIANGVIPKNRFGNIELFKPSMLPPGTAQITIEAICQQNEFLSHTFETIRMPSLKRIASSLEIDFAEAVIGFENRGGRNIPVIDGIVVAEEYGTRVKQEFLKKLLNDLDDWRDKHEDEIYKRWERIVKKAIHLDKLKKLYDNE